MSILGQAARRARRILRGTTVDRAPLTARVDEMVERLTGWGPMPTLAAPISQPCTHAQFLEPVYDEWRALFSETSVFNRKVWEWAWICQTLRLHLEAAEGPLDLAGFGVGTEPIVGWLAGCGHRVLATDLPGDDADAARWATTNQHAGTSEQLDPRRLATAEQMAANVRFRPVDMREVPADLGEFDAVWSSCAIEHLGSLDAGFDFVRRTLDHCRPGAISVHTTELNVSDDHHTVDSGHTVVYRRADLEAFFAELTEAGHQVASTFNLGGSPEDRHVDLPPFSDHHLKVPVDDVVATSFGLVIRVA